MNTAELKTVQKPSVLIVEDEWIVSLELQEHLKQMGYGIIGSVDEGIDAIEKLYHHTPDVILMDIKLKGNMDGIETSQKIRKEFNIPIIFLTANTDENTYGRAMATNPYGYIQKPFNSRELNLTIKCALDKAEFEQKMGMAYMKLVSMIGRLSAGVILVDDAGEINMINNRAAGITEWPETETIGSNVDLIYKTYGDSDCVRRRINFSSRIITERGPAIQRLYLKTINGIIKKIIQKKYFLYSKNGKFQNLIIIFDEHKISAEVQKNAWSIVHDLQELF
ncbi:response regulator [bacterium]|nr:response regulator [bacterium]